MQAIVLFSGGIDSTTVLAMAKADGKTCLALSFDYGQRHRIELEHAAFLASYYKSPHLVIKISPDCFGASSLVNAAALPQHRTPQEISADSYASTYVPARNALFLAYAAGQAEIHHAEEIHCGPNSDDKNSYPDCRPEFYAAFRQLLFSATRQGAEGDPPKIITPLIDWNKKRIVEEARKLNVPLDRTFSCYNPIEKMPCSVCDACVLRQDALS